MARPLHRKLQGIVPFELIVHGTPSTSGVPSVELEERGQGLRISLAIPPGMTCRQALAGLASRGRRICGTLKGRGGRPWPADLSLTIEMDGLFLVVRCALDLSDPLHQGRRTTSRRAGHARAMASTIRTGAWTELDQIGVLTRLVHRQRQAEASAESWSFDGQRVIQEWRTSASITFGEFLKALGNHTIAMLQWRPQFLRFFASGQNSATKGTMRGQPIH